MFTRIVQWIDERFPLSSMIRLLLDEEIPGGASFAYVLGSATLVVFVIQMITGVWQLFYYVPTVDHAYDSVNYLRTEVPFGWLIHGLHYWGANAIIVLVGLHIARVFIYGAYKHPRELIWLAGVGLLLLTAALVFTGAPLPWDERGYWAAEVGTSIAGTVPIIGDAVKRLMRGGDLMGQLALSRMFIMHVAILPAILFAFLFIHLTAFRQFGSVGPWDESKRLRSGPFWPDQVLKDALAATALLLLLVFLCAYFPPPFSGPADPLDTSYIPKPEWNFLFLYQALKYFPGRLEPIGTVGIPLVGITILVLVPFLGRSTDRSPRRRPIAMTGGVMWVGAVAAFTVAGYLSHPGAVTTGSRAPSGSEATLSPSARQGAKLVHSLGCTGCHSINGTGGTVGPDLSDEARRGHSRSWLKEQIRNPKSHAPNSIMPPNTSLTNQEMNQIVDYLQSLGAVGSPAASPPAVKGKAREGDPPVTNSAMPSVAVPGTDRAKPGAPVDPPGPAAKAGNPPATNGTTSSVAVHGTGPVTPVGPPGPAASIIGSAQHGAVLFRTYCTSCHGPDGKGGVANPGSAAGTIPRLNPIDRTLYSADPQTFATNIDRILQHGAIPTGPMQERQMPAFGTLHKPTQPELADLEAYILELNGVDRAQMPHPGISPKTFFQLTLAALALIAVGLGLVRTFTHRRTGGDAH